MATRLPSFPKNLLQQILADADTYHTGTKDFFAQNGLIYQETVYQQGYLSNQDWDKQTINFLEKHRFYTNCCREKMEERKKKNLKDLKKELETLNQITPKKTKQKENKKAEQPKGITRLMKLSITHQLHLIAQADNKANILIAVSFVAISTLLSALAFMGFGHHLLIIPVFTLLFFSLLTLILAIVATRLSSTNQLPGDTKNTGLPIAVNYKIPFEDFEKQMNEMMCNPDSLNRLLTRYVYDLGVIIDRKNKLILLAFTVSMIGSVTAVLATTIVLFFMSAKY